MWRKLSEYEENHGIQVVFCDNRETAKDRVIRIFDDVTEILAREEPE